MSAELRFLDTNILVYANDLSAPEKRERARALIEQGLREDSLILSTQVLAEFWVTVTRKLAVPLDPVLARRQIAAVSVLKVVPVDLAVVMEALDIQDRCGVSYRDAQILAAAKAGGAKLALSEDLADGPDYAGVRVENPFR
jgi:predicted nucleic acid-binding protein